MKDKLINLAALRSIKDQVLQTQIRYLLQKPCTRDIMAARLRSTSEAALRPLVRYLLTKQCDNPINFFAEYFDVDYDGAFGEKWSPAPVRSINGRGENISSAFYSRYEAGFSQNKFTVELSAAITYADNGRREWELDIFGVKFSFWTEYNEDVKDIRMQRQYTLYCLDQFREYEVGYSEKGPTEDQQFTLPNGTVFEYESDGPIYNLETFTFDFIADASSAPGQSMSASEYYGYGSGETFLDSSAPEEFRQYIVDNSRWSLGLHYNGDELNTVDATNVTGPFIRNGTEYPVTSESFRRVDYTATSRLVANTFDEGVTQLVIDGQISGSPTISKTQAKLEQMRQEAYQQLSDLGCDMETFGLSMGLGGLSYTYNSVMDYWRLNAYFKAVRYGSGGEGEIYRISTRERDLEIDNVPSRLVNQTKAQVNGDDFNGVFDLYYNELDEDMLLEQVHITATLDKDAGKCVVDIKTAGPSGPAVDFIDTINLMDGFNYTDKVGFGCKNMELQTRINYIRGYVTGHNPPTDSGHGWYNPDTGKRKYTFQPEG